MGQLTQEDDKDTGELVRLALTLSDECRLDGSGDYEVTVRCDAEKIVAALVPVEAS